MSAESIAQSDAALAVLDDPIEQGRFTRWISGAAGERLAESSLQLAGMHCAACAGIIESALTALPGVRSARVSAAAERATVCWDPAHTRPAALIEAVRKAGYDAVPDAAAPARELRRRAHRQALWRLFVAAFCAMQVMMMATPSYVAGPGELAPDLRQLLNWGSWLLSLPVMLFAAGPYFSGAWRMLRQRRIGMDVPVALGIAITFIASTAATFEPNGIFGHEVYFDSLTMFVSFPAGRALSGTACAACGGAVAGRRAGLPARDRIARVGRRRQRSRLLCTGCAPVTACACLSGWPSRPTACWCRAARRPTKRCSAAIGARAESRRRPRSWPAASTAARRC